MYTTVTTVRVSSLGPNQTANLTFEIPARLESSIGQLSVSLVIPAAGIVDMSALLTKVGLVPYVGTIALQGTTAFDVSLFASGGVDVYSGVFSENYLRSINGVVSHVKVKAKTGTSSVELTGLITHGLVS
jgi:hypothetical protein